jgi:hypothetical protein
MEIGLMADNVETPDAPAQRQQEGQQAQRAAAQQIQVTDEGVLSLYANFCRVTGTPEELIIDFGLNPQPVGIPKDPIKLTQRIIVNHYTAKRLLAALSASVQRHEAVFGVLETDITKRVQPSGQRGS